MPESAPSPISPPTHRLKTIGLTLLVIVLIGFLGIFLILSAYYFWLIKNDRAAIFEQQFQGEFTVDPSLPTGSSRTYTKHEVEAFIRPFNPIRGEKDAPLTLIMFIDFECPYCQKSYPIVESVVARYGPTIKVVFKHFPIPSAHPNAVLAGVAATCAHDQGGFWPYYQKLFQTKKLTEPDLLATANTIGLQPTTFQACLKREDHIKELTQDLRDGVALNVGGTPTYFLNGKEIKGVISETQWDTLILEQLQL